MNYSDFLVYVPVAVLTSIGAVVAVSAKGKTPKFKKPVNGRITSPFGDRINPVTKVKQFHNGVDLAVSVGTPIICPMDGKVERIFSNDIGGSQLIVKHDNGLRTGYAHLSGCPLHIGAKVKTGDIIAYTGNTGRSTGPHLHFTLTDVKGNKVNPVDYFL